MISRYCGEIGIIARRTFYSSSLKNCGKNLRVGYGAYIVYPDTEIGNNCAIEEYSVVSRCKIGNDVVIAAGTSLMSGAHHHDVDDLEHTFLFSKDGSRKITLGDNIWIGTNAVVMTDVASDTIIGAGSVVTRTFPPYSIIAGVPAKVIRKRGEKKN
jgi:acetyltransferase-like isoleucine patch superfamily enzyme